MNTQLVEIQPRELKFIFEVKKQSSCAVQLANVTDQYVAFKVKTTSPKKYCVRPNVGIIKPNSTYDFTVTMQAQKSPPAETQCKDKFLIQSTVVPFGTTEDEITSGMFVKNNEKYIEETKLRVVLTSAPNSPVVQQVLQQEASYKAFMLKEPHSPVLLPVNGVLKQEPSNETSTTQGPGPGPGPGVSKQEASYEVLTPKEPNSPVLLTINGVPKQEPSDENSMPKIKLQSGVENIPPPDTLMIKDEGIQNIRNMEETISPSVVMDICTPILVNDEEAKWVKEMEDAKLKLAKDIEELKKKISSMDVKLMEAEYTIVKLKEEKNSTIHDMEMLKQEMAMTKREGGRRKVHVGFPPIFVCMVAMISLVLGFLFRS